MVPVSPLLPEFLRLLRQSATGALRFEFSERKVVVIIHQGGVVQVVGLPEILDLSGHGLTSSVPSGDMLAAIGTAVGGGVPISEAMESAASGLGHFLARVAFDPDSKVTWEEGVEPPKGAFPLTFPMIKALAGGLQAARTPEMVRLQWRSRAAQFVRPTDAAQDPGSTKGLSPMAARALNLSSKGEVLSELAERLVGGDPRRMTKTWWALDLLLNAGLLGFEGPSTAEIEIDEDPEYDEDASQDSISSEEKSKERAPVVDLQRQYRRLLKQSPLEALEIGLEDLEKGLKVEVVREAFRRAAKKYHPDRFLGQPSAVERAAALCFQVLGEYRSQMEEPERLQSEAERLKAKLEGRVLVTEDDKVKAKVLYNKGMSFLRNRAYEAGRDAFAKALEQDPGQRMARARHIHCQAVLKEMAYDKAFVDLSEIVGENVEEKVELLYLTAWLLKLLGREKEAIKQYRAILSSKPDHRDALREIRLWEKRAAERDGGSKKSDKGEALSSGLFRAIRKRRDS